jgi:Rhodopirellula transposase DDE domain
LLNLVEPETAGDPMSEQKWLRSSLRSLSERLEQVGHQASAPTVSRLLQKHDYALRVNAKKKEAGAQHPERDAQFRYLESQKQVFRAAGEPIISVDTKNKELIGASIMTSATPFCFCTTQKHLTVKRARSSRA